MIRISRQTVAAALEAVAQATEQQSGSYQGPREIDDAPAQSVVDLSAFQTPVEPALFQTVETVASGDEYYYDTLHFEDSATAFTEGPKVKKFGFLRWARLLVRNIGGTTGSFDIRIKPETGYDGLSAVFEPQLYRKVPGSGSSLLVQYNYDSPDQDASQDNVVPPPSFVLPPESRMVFQVFNNTDDDLTFAIIGYSYLFDETDVLI